MNSRLALRHTSLTATREPPSNSTLYVTDVLQVHDEPGARFINVIFRLASLTEILEATHMLIIENDSHHDFSGE